MKKKLIIFDFFNVICNEISPTWMRRYLSDAEADRAKLEIVGKADTGEYSEMKMYEELSKLTGVPAKDVGKQWQEMAQVREDMVAFIKDLSKSYKTVLLSNAPEGFLDRILDEHNLRILFNSGIVISADFGKAKPGPEIYMEALRLGGEDAKDAIFIDDNPKNIEGAAKVGIDGIVYTGLEDLKKELVKFNIY
ncbi:MAG: HAD family phosphatase [Lachnospiraceae bacterium]|nr:HAD family phosphatase [Lachnospiraceae bacterium]